MEIDKILHSGDAEDPKSASTSSIPKKGGWITLPFILAMVTGISLAYGGLVSNLIVYLIQEFNVKSISAAKIFNVVNGCVSIFPVAGAIIADSYLGCYSVVWISSLISSLGMLLISLTAAFSKLRPPHCENGSNLCRSPSEFQFAVLYISLALASIGMAGTRFTVGPMGANQFDKPKYQGIFFNWYIFVMYISTAVCSTAIVYIQDNVSWAWGFGICFAGNVIGLVLFLAGSGFYHRIKPHGSPFASLGRVIVAATRKRNLLLSLKSEDYCQDHRNMTFIMPTKFFRFLNRAALKTEGDAELAGSIRKSWRLCTVKEVEDFKSLIKMLPLWSSALLVAVPLVIQLSMVIIQALTMDRHIGAHFKIPAGTMPVFISISTCITIFFLDRLLFPVWEKFTHRPITTLQRVGIGHLLDVLSMAVLALVEAKRLKTVQLHNIEGHDNAVVPMSVFWLVPSLALAGIGEAFHFPGHISFYYQEFPASLKSTSTAVVALSIGIGFYMGNALIDLVRKTTDWLPDNINRGRLDNVYWLITILGGLNFCYFLGCACLYKYQNVENSTDASVNEK
ncbi:protein NRT1/ PTR FAMILY 2.7-like [Coffea eugenioides]|uniref:Protein NRT1/ PTR FAMILY 2.4-like n=1 Tax=Coffea arabica TaxID=13443 RepID=A0A6P6U8G2_COFAR|nr:protein NRT1/ PTR FAMILY 2.7-like isoform X1 [Coffea arabica]XP_027157083.1 protein NRT1/ PTR FAMILY 2.7-like [Coffea eugenioides]XP_027175271.1 protein NRT1/ PTR FAMILY 2.7-like [Coffea eugenioides]